MDAKFYKPDVRIVINCQLIEHYCIDGKGVVYINRRPSVKTFREATDWAESLQQAQRNTYMGRYVIAHKMKGSVNK